MAKRLGFTLTEALVMMAVVAGIAVMTFSSMSDIMPNKEKTLVRKAYKETVETVQTLINDKDLYPDYYDASKYQIAYYNLEPTMLSAYALVTSDDTTGWTTCENTTVPADLSVYESEVVDDNVTKTHSEITKNTKVGFLFTEVPLNVATADPKPYTSKQKFAYNFAKLLTKKTINCPANNYYCTFYTDDGIYWEVYDYFGNNGSNPTNVYVKVNGVYHRFKVYADGHILADTYNSKTQEYIKSIEYK